MVTEVKTDPVADLIDIIPHQVIGRLQNPEHLIVKAGLADHPPSALSLRNIRQGPVNRYGDIPVEMNEESSNDQ
jgi:hypothetical protein